MVSQMERIEEMQIDDRSKTLMQRFNVSYEFPVCFTEDVFDPLNRTLVNALCRLEPNKRHRIFFAVDEGLCRVRPDLTELIYEYANYHSANMELVTSPMQVPGGEAIKSNLHFIEQIQNALFKHKIDRHSYVIAIGGGAVLDAVGLVAATSHRGIRHIRLPTTVLSQNDSGVGVKNGINLFNTKNYVGTFSPPFAVINDIAFIEGLEDRDKIAGMAEAVKVALIRDDRFFDWLEENAPALALFSRNEMAYMIQRCAELHMHQIGYGGDPFEFGSARPLDYGHWSAHKLESLTRYHLRHGEAVAIGIALDARYSVEVGLLAEGEEQRIYSLLERLGFKLWHPAIEMRNADGVLEVLKGLHDFREHLGGELTITLLERNGVGVEVHEMDFRRIENSIAWLKAKAIET
jgi:3-dehydroquinate synthase